MLPIWPEVSMDLAVLLALAAGMVVFNLWVFLQFFPRRGGVPNLSRAMFVALILITSAMLWLSLLYDAQTADSDNGFIAILFGINIMMSTPFVWCAALILRANERTIDPEDLIWSTLLALIVVGNEILMGAVYEVWLYGYATVFPNGPWGAAVAFSDAVGSIWFTLAMVVNMAVLLYWLPIPAPRRHVLLGLAATSVATPWVVSDSPAGAVGMGVIMGLTVALAALGLRTEEGQTRVYARTVLGTMIGFAAMSFGAIVSLQASPAIWAPLPLTTTVVVVMLLELFFVAQGSLSLGGAPTPDAPIDLLPEPAGA